MTANGALIDNSRSSRRQLFIGSIGAATASAVFLLWILFNIGGTHTTLRVDDIGQWVAAWCASTFCTVASVRASSGKATWALFAASSFSWGAGEGVWCYYALMRNTPVPFPSLADVGFLTAVPLAFAALLMYPGAKAIPGSRMRGMLDACIIATSLLFASWVTILGPLYRSHQGGAFKQVISLAYPMSDVIMVSLVIILIARGGHHEQVHLALVMAGVVAFAIADSSFTYLTEVNSYTGGSYLDTGWVAGYMLIGLGALWAVSSPSDDDETLRESTISLVAPYLPVLLVLAVTGIQLLRGKHMETVSWFMAFALAIMALAREILALMDKAVQARQISSGPDIENHLIGR